MSVLSACLTTEVLSISNEACQFGSFESVFHVNVCVHAGVAQKWSETNCEELARHAR